jgi:hypothetical protein
MVLTVARTYRVAIKCTTAESILNMSTLHYQTDLSFIGDEPDPSDVAAGVWNKIGTTFTALTPATTRINELVVSEEVIKPAIGAAGSKVIDTLGGWAVGDTHLPSPACAVLNIHTAVRSKSARGWTHLPSPHDSTLVVNNGWISGAVTKYVALAAVLDDSFDLGTINVTHVNPVVYSRKRHAAAESPYTFRVTSATLSPQIKWLRSRLSAP